MAYNFTCIYVVNKSFHIINQLLSCVLAFLFVNEIVNSLLAFATACFRGFQIILKFALWMIALFFVVHNCNQSFGDLFITFFTKNEDIYGFPFCGFSFKFCICWFSRMKIHGLWPFPWKRSVWQNPDRLTTNKSTRIQLRNTLLYNK